MKMEHIKGNVFNGLLSIILLIAIFWLCGSKIVQAGAWVLSNSRWTEKEEKTYQDFVQTLGESNHGSLNKFIKDPGVNPLYGEEDKSFNLSPDCADFPYLVRAYVAYKLRLPFSYVSEISSGGGDQRYSRGNRPSEMKDQDYFSSAQRMFGAIPRVNSGFYRMAPDVEDSDTYPVKIQKESIVPGTVYYDPNGHVALVYKVTEDGRIRMIDAHPDRTISRPWFGSKFARGGQSQGGGFRKWRPLWYSSEGKVSRSSNRNIPDFSGSDQYRDNYDFQGLNSLSYFDYVRFKLSQKGGKIDPVSDFKTMMTDIYEDIRYRALAVEICIQHGVNLKHHPGVLPYNIYGTDGEWEEFSTPSRDARLKVAFYEFYRKTIEMIQMAEKRASYLEYSGSGRELARRLISIFDELNPQLCVTYKNSSGNVIAMDFYGVLRRLFHLSFDPYHSVELRWGASGEELKSAKDDDEKKKFYALERRMRNQLERLYNVHTTFSLGPETPINVDVRKWLVDYVENRAMPIAPVPSSPVLAQNPNATGRDTSVVTPDLREKIPTGKPTSSSEISPLSGINERRKLWRFTETVLSKLDDLALEVIVENRGNHDLTTRQSGYFLTGSKQYGETVR